jgi:hypothetical protein
MSDSITDRNVYILGAGFSADANAPLLYNFLDKSRELLNDPASGLEKQERDEFKVVFDFRRKMTQAREKVKMDLDNIEQLFGLVEMQQRLGQNATDARRATVYLIAKTLESMIAKAGKRQPIQLWNNQALSGSSDLFKKFGLLLNEGFSPPKAILDIYDLFARIIGGQFDQPQKRLHRKDVVITFNYDLVLDHALMRANIPISYHLPEKNVSVPAANNGDGLSLLKLHGSTNWGICTDCKEYIFVSVDGTASYPGIFKNMECIKCGQRAFQPMLVPPSWDKTEYRDLIQPVWSRAVDELKQATRICIIGYSLPESDAYFKYLLTLGLSENHGLYKFIVVDWAQPTQPNWDERQQSVRVKTLQDRYNELLEDLFRERRFAFHNDGLWGWINNGTILPDLGRGEMILIG